MFDLIQEVPAFQSWPKTPRLRNVRCTITEKIDGTNGLIYVGHGFIMAGSRNRWLSPNEKGGDNYGFGAWVRDNAEALIEILGPGYHYGEWWGVGIARGYGMRERRFSLFNTARWAPTSGDCLDPEIGLWVVPTLVERNLNGLEAGVEDALRDLRTVGSAAAPGFADPEGIVVHFMGNNYKVLLKGDEIPGKQ